MAIFTRGQFASDGDDAGVFIEDLAQAVQTLCTMNGENGITVAAAAKIFNTTPAVIIEAVDFGPWTYIVDLTESPETQIIELDGE